MRNRALSTSGDYQFGRSDALFHVNSAEAVAQAVRTRFELHAGEWYLDLLEGTPYESRILGENTTQTYDQVIQERILGTAGVVAIRDYASVLDSSRRLTVSASIDTIYGATFLTLGGASSSTSSESTPSQSGGGYVDGGYVAN